MIHLCTVCCKVSGFLHYALLLFLLPYCRCHHRFPESLKETIMPCHFPQLPHADLSGWWIVLTFLMK